jgi:hypothetical protein
VQQRLPPALAGAERHGAATSAQDLILAVAALSIIFRHASGLVLGETASPRNTRTARFNRSNAWMAVGR